MQGTSTFTKGTSNLTMVSSKTRTRKESREKGWKNGSAMGIHGGILSIPVEFLSYSNLLELTGKLLTRIGQLENLVHSQSHPNRRIKADSEYKGIGGPIKDMGTQGQSKDILEAGGGKL